MRLAITVWEGKVSPVFDTAGRLLVLDLDNKREIERFVIPLQEEDPSRRCLVIKRLGVNQLICGAISRPLQEMLSACEVQVTAWITGAYDRVLEAWLDGSLLDREEFRMPGRFQATESKGEIRRLK